MRAPHPPHSYVGISFFTLFTRTAPFLSSGVLLHISSCLQVPDPPHSYVGISFFTLFTRTAPFVARRRFSSKCRAWTRVKTAPSSTSSEAK